MGRRHHRRWQAGEEATTTTPSSAAAGALAAGGDDLEDFFSFDIEKVSDLTGGSDGVRCKVVAYLGPLPDLPIVDHITDKLAAMVSSYANGAPGSRYRDLVDLVLIATTRTVDAELAAARRAAGPITA